MYTFLRVRFNLKKEESCGKKISQQYLASRKCTVATHDTKTSCVQLHKNALSTELIDISFQMITDEVPASDEEDINISVRDWVLATYDGDGQSYPGEVTYTDSKQLQVNVMQKSGSYFKWPRIKDNIFYRCENVVQKLSAPVLAGNRGQFTFKELMLTHH